MSLISLSPRKYSTDLPTTIIAKLHQERRWLSFLCLETRMANWKLRFSKSTTNCSSVLFNPADVDDSVCYVRVVVAPPIIINLMHLQLLQSNQNLLKSDNEEWRILLPVLIGTRFLVLWPFHCSVRWISGQWTGMTRSVLPGTLSKNQGRIKSLKVEDDGIGPPSKRIHHENSNRLQAAFLLWCLEEKLGWAAGRVAAKSANKGTGREKNIIKENAKVEHQRENRKESAKHSQEDLPLVLTAKAVIKAFTSTQKDVKSSGATKLTLTRASTQSWGDEVKCKCTQIAAHGFNTTFASDLVKKVPLGHEILKKEYSNRSGNRSFSHARTNPKVPWVMTF